MDNTFKYCDRCDDETLHVDGGCRRCVTRNKVFMNIPMHILHAMVTTYDVDANESIDRVVDALRPEIIDAYEMWKKETGIE